MHWKEREPVYVRRRQLAIEDYGGDVPAYAPGTFGDEQEGEMVSTPARRGPERQRLGRAGRPSARPSTRGNGPGERAPQTGTAVEEPPEVEAAPEPEPEPERVEEPEATVDEPTTGNGADGSDGDSRSSSTSTTGPNQPRKKQQQQQRRRKRHGRR